MSKSIQMLNDAPLYEAVFISDLHLHPEHAEIDARFTAFIHWAEKSTRRLYVLGDLFHAWPGDDGMDSWAKGIAKRFAWLASQGVTLYFMAGNRDFLVGPQFLEQAQMIHLEEPSLVQLGPLSILLVHGDRYCTRDRGHQVLRLLTRNPWFKRVFLSLPFAFRVRCVNQVRSHSQNHRKKSYETMQVVEKSVQRHLKKMQTSCVIHGHTHQPGVTIQPQYQRYVLSDWDDEPRFLCYNEANGLLLRTMRGV